jgi:CBS domain-containing protein
LNPKPVQLHQTKNFTYENDMDDHHYRALPHSTLLSGTAYHLPDRIAAPLVDAGSPAVDVMTDLRQIAAVTIAFDALIEAANQKMIAHGIRTLIVLDEQRHVNGIFTLTDILGEKPLQFSQQRGVGPADIKVGDIMTPASRIEVIDLAAVLNSRVGDVLETLKLSRRQHALVVDEASGGRQMVRGIFSRTQIERQLGLTPVPPETGQTFAEIETAIGA